MRCMSLKRGKKYVCVKLAGVSEVGGRPGGTCERSRGIRVKAIVSRARSMRNGFVIELTSAKTQLHNRYEYRPSVK
jgi:hypothetical protein